jgi:hypothetical protein
VAAILETATATAIVTVADEVETANDREEAEPEISPDDVLISVAGILDVLETTRSFALPATFQVQMTFMCLWGR